MKKYIFSVIALAASLAGCTGDYTDWASPISNEQPQTVTFGDGSVSEVELIDYADDAVAASENVQVCSIVAPTASDASYSDVTYIINLDGEANGLTADGKIPTDALKNLVEKKYGKAPQERDITATVEQWISNGTTTVKTATSATFQVKVKLNAPVIYDHLYLIGGVVGGEWDAASTALPFQHSDANVYDDPVFTITVPVVDGDTWFAITDDHTVATNDWSQVFGCREGNGKNYIGQTGNLTRRADLSDDGSFMIHVDGDAKSMKITVNMLEGTYLIEKVNYNPYVYFIGSTDGWAASDQKLALTDADNGIYTGFVYVADPNGWGLAGKFQKVQGSWDDQINAGNLASMTGVTGSDNIEFPAEGVYYMTLDLVKNTLEATQVTTMGIIGDFNSWGGDVEMTWDATDYCYVATGAGVTANGWKFRVNGGWDVNLGGSITNLIQNGDNLSVVGNTVKLYPTRKTNNNIYCTVE